MCAGLWCLVEGDTSCKTKLDPPLDGTECGADKVNPWLPAAPNRQLHVSQAIGTSPSETLSVLYLRAPETSPRHHRNARGAHSGHRVVPTSPHSFFL